MADSLGLFKIEWIDDEIRFHHSDHNAEEKRFDELTEKNGGYFMSLKI